MTINHILYVMDEYVLTLAHIVRISTGLTEFNDLSCHSVPPCCLLELVPHDRFIRKPNW